MASLLGEIRRRKVFQVAAVYAVVAWLLIQIVATVESPLQLPTWFDTLPNSIAVLPFENMSPNPDHAYFAAGIHEEILNSLAKLKSLSVIARTSVLQYAGTRKAIAEIAGALGVETIMEGSVRYAGDPVLERPEFVEVRARLKGD